MIKKPAFISFLIFFLVLPAAGQDVKISSSITGEKWDAQWITHIKGKYEPDVQGVFLFRKAFSLDQKPEEFIIHVSADNRYQLYVNEQIAGRGPARSGIDHWAFESYDISGYLKEGENIIAAKVWNYGDLRPWSRQSVKTGFILNGNTDKESLLNTNHSWKVFEDAAYVFESHDKDFFPATTGVGPCERFYAEKHPWEWKKRDYDDTAWLPASEIGRGRPVKANAEKYLWSLEPSEIPQLTYTPERLKKIVRTEGMEKDEAFLSGEGKLEIPAHSKAKILLDREEITTAYPVLTFSGGKNSKIRLVYNEALYNDQKQKVERYRTEGLQLIGYYDHVFPDGGSHREYQPLWFRTYRFVELNIETREEPLVLHDFKAYKATFPFELKASFSSSDKTLEEIFLAGWRTALNSAHETYEDCPYYEQLQYFGDLNISGLVTVLLSGDTRLMARAIRQGEESRKSGHLTTCAYPTHEEGKIIPYFSIAWIGMISNYYLYGDTAAVRKYIPSIEAVLSWYKDQLNDQYMLGPMPYWNFLDCTPAWPWAPEKGSICEPAGTYSGNSSILSLQYVYGLQLAEKLFAQLGEMNKAAEYHELAEKIKEACYRLCWDEEKQYLADTPEKNSFSQHANVYAALTGVFPEDKSREILQRLTDDPNLTQMSLQFRVYYHRAMVKAGLAGYYPSSLDPWRRLLDWGFTTFPEYPELNTRSDCHPWNAYPSYELLTVVCGINASSPGFESVRIEPHIGNLEWVEGTLPHKKGKIRVRLEQDENFLKAEIFIPEGLPASFHWKGKTIRLHDGLNEIPPLHVHNLNRNEEPFE